MRRAQATQVLVTILRSALVALLVALLVAPLALAASPKRLASPVTDDAGALPSGAASRIQAAFDRVQTASGVQPWVWYLGSTDGADPAAFAADTASESGLGGADVLLVIAMNDRAYGYWKGDAVPMSNSDFELLLSSTLPQNLRANDPTQAALDFADALRAALTATPAPTAAPTSVPTTGPVATAGPGPGPSSGNGDGTLPTLLALAAVTGGSVLIVRYLATHREATGNAVRGPATARDDLAGMSDKDLEALANSLLVETDDAIRDSDQELGFAQAQFGDAAAAPFAEAIATARASLSGAFKIRQQLDDTTPEPPSLRRQMLEQLVRACREAQSQLDALTARFDALRALQKEAPGIIEALPGQADALEARARASAQTMAHVRTYADADWVAVAPNLDEADKRIAAVRAAVVAGRAAVAAGEGPKAAAAAQAGQDALAQGARFLDAIDALSKELDEASALVAAQLAAAEEDVARANAALASGAGPTAGAQLAEATQLLAEARTALLPPKPDVRTALDKSRRAEKAAEDLLAQIRTAQEAEARAAAQLDASIRTAQAAVTRAGGLIATRRGGVGTEARTRLAEAQRHLDQSVAIARSDRAAAVREADAASRLAAEAESLAQRDYGNWNDPWRGGGGGGSTNSDLAGAIIGGIIGGILSGGGGGSGPFGGGGPGPFGGGGSGPFGGGHRAGGGFGGFGGGWGGGHGGGGHGGSSGSGRW